ncbi:transmembrane and coiled-coil domain-containing protein 6 isoform X2 [Zonotrichia albicollis]|uniref:transmembrane and coiled-coil domain-containing protein 6 isoform X2 n=1 Tax=Zonotrichia albicollis TaxID=44394 RepID=UPI003D8101A0
MRKGAGIVFSPPRDRPTTALGRPQTAFSSSFSSSFFSSPGSAMWARRRARRGGHSAEELRVRRREREAALRRARRQQQLVSKRLLREDSAAQEGTQDGADVVPDPLSEDEVLELLRGVQRGSEDRRRWLGRLRWALQNEDTQQKFVRLDGSIRTLTGLFTSSLAELQLEAARCLHELSHSSVPAVAEACLPVTSYLLTYLSGHSLELTELCLYTLGNLVVESEAVRKQLLPQGIIPVLASCIQSPHEAVLEGVGCVLPQLCALCCSPLTRQCWKVWAMSSLSSSKPRKHPQRSSRWSWTQLCPSTCSSWSALASRLPWEQLWSLPGVSTTSFVGTRTTSCCWHWGPCPRSPRCCSTWLPRSPRRLPRAWSCWCAPCCGASVTCWHRQTARARTDGCSSPCSSSCSASCSSTPSSSTSACGCSTTSQRMIPPAALLCSPWTCCQPCCSS